MRSVTHNRLGLPDPISQLSNPFSPRWISYPYSIFGAVQAQLVFSTDTFLPSTFFPHLASSELKMKYSFLSLNNHIHMFFNLHMTFHSIIQLLHQLSYEIFFFCFYIMLTSKYKEVFGNIVLVTLFVFFKNMCG